MIPNSEESWKLIRLKGVSRHGKNRIREWGDLWWIVEGATTVRFADGLHLGVLSQKDFKLEKSFRWVRLQGDPDFEII